MKKANKKKIKFRYNFGGGVDINGLYQDSNQIQGYNPELQANTKLATVPESSIGASKGGGGFGSFMNFKMPSVPTNAQDNEAGDKYKQATSALNNVPIVGQFKAMGDAAEGIGTAIGGQRGGNAVQGFTDPLGRQIEILKDKGYTKGQKVAAAIVPFASGFMKEKVRGNKGLTYGLDLSTEDGEAGFAANGGQVITRDEAINTEEIGTYKTNGYRNGGKFKCYGKGGETQSYHNVSAIDPKDMKKMFSSHKIDIYEVGGDLHSDPSGGTPIAFSSGYKGDTVMAEKGELLIHKKGGDEDDETLYFVTNKNDLSKKYKSKLKNLPQYDYLTASKFADKAMQDNDKYLETISPKQEVMGDGGKTELSNKKVVDLAKDEVGWGEFAARSTDESGKNYYNLNSIDEQRIKNLVDRGLLYNLNPFNYEDRLKFAEQDSINQVNPEGLQMKKTIAPLQMKKTLSPMPQMKYGGEVKTKYAGGGGVNPPFEDDYFRTGPTYNEGDELGLDNTPLQNAQAFNTTGNLSSKVNYNTGDISMNTISPGGSPIEAKRYSVAPITPNTQESGPEKDKFFTKENALGITGTATNMAASLYGLLANKPHYVDYSDVLGNYDYKIQQGKEYLQKAKGANNEEIALSSNVNRQAARNTGNYNTMASALASISGADSRARTQSNAAYDTQMANYISGTAGQRANIAFQTKSAKDLINTQEYDKFVENNIKSIDRVGTSFKELQLQRNQKITNQQLQKLIEKSGLAGSKEMIKALLQRDYGLVVQDEESRMRNKIEDK